MKKMDGIVKEAFCKLQSSTYFEKLNLHLRHKMVEFCYDNRLEGFENKILDDEYDDVFFNGLLNRVGLFMLPKKLCKQDKDNEDGNLICNDYNYDNNVVERLMIYADIPVELHIVAVLWLMFFGPELDLQLDKYCWGNRLLIDSDTKEIKKGRWLYKPYQKQYQQWWSKATEEANHLLKNKENVCILNLDIQNYFHSVRFDFDELDFLKPKQDDGSEEFKLKKRVWDLLIQVHDHYNKTLKSYGIWSGEEEKGFALPVGLPTSSLLGNWYLKDFDKKVNEELAPVYYGRYVDDILIVSKSGKKPENVVDYINGLHLGLEMSKKQDGKKDDDKKKESVFWCFTNHPELKLQEEKIFLYHFDHRYTSELLSKFEKEQLERSSEYRFLSDEEDKNFNDDCLDFESCFDQEESTKARFKPQIENKYKLSVFLAKFIRRRIERGKNYGKNKDKSKDKEVQIKKYFQGSILIKHYYFWEKLFTLYVVSEDKSSICELHNKIEEEINKLEIKRIDEWKKDFEDKKEKIKENLRDYLKCALLSAMSISHLDELDEMIVKKTHVESKEWQQYRTVFINRCHYERQILGGLYNEGVYHLDGLKLPYNLKLSELVFALTYNKIKDYGTLEQCELELDTCEIIRRAVEKYHELNGYKEDDRLHIISFGDGSEPWSVVELNDGLEKDKLTIVSVNQLVEKKTVQSSRRGKRQLKSQDVESYVFILDSLVKLKEFDMFVMSELSLPWDMLPTFMQFSRNHQVAFVAGMEYLKIGDVVYNFVITCLPIEIDHSKDCIPIFRLKKAYAPQEVDYSRDELFKIPKSKDPFHLYKWKGMHFTVFNCFELTDVADRSKFVSIVDALIAVAYNHDVPYFDNIAEVVSRDLHCYMVLNNVSEPGSSQISAPKKSEYKILLKTIRGTTPRNVVTIETAEIDIKGLRLYQRYLQQDKDKPFKSLPAGYKRDVERLKNV